MHILVIFWLFFQVTFWPGHRFNLHLTGWDQFDHPTFVSARFFALTNSSSVSKTTGQPELHKYMFENCIYNTCEYRRYWNGTDSWKSIKLIFLSQNTVSLHPPLVITDSNKQSSGHLSSQYTLTYAVSNVIPLNNNHERLANVQIDVPFQDDNVSLNCMVW